MKNFTFLLGLALLAACSSSDDKSAVEPGTTVITQNDFESLAGWNTAPTALFRGKAHSGSYALKVDQEHEFSTTFDMALGFATPTRIKTLHLEAWAMLPGQKSTGVLGIQIVDPETNAQVHSFGIKLAEVVKARNKWEKVEADYELPATITSAQHLRLSLWRADAAEVVLVDDIKLTAK